MPILLWFFVLLISKPAEFSVHDSFQKQVSEKIDGPANIRDSINGKILFTLLNDVQVECSEEFNNWHRVGVFVKISQKQFLQLKIYSGDTLFDDRGAIIGIAKAQVNILFVETHKPCYMGLITGYTNLKNIKPETVVENALSEIVNSKRTVTLNDIQPVIKLFNMKPCSPVQMSDENGSWYFYEDTVIDDISPRDRITLIIEEEILLGIVHSRNLNLKNKTAIALIRGHKFTPVASLSDAEIKEITEERIKWYNSVD